MLSSAMRRESLCRLFIDLGIQAQVPFHLHLPCGAIEGEAMIHGFGYEIGVVVVTDVIQLGGLEPLLPQFGYGYHLVVESGNTPWTDTSYWKKVLGFLQWTGTGAPPIWYTR